MKNAQLTPTPIPTPTSVPLSESEDSADVEEDAEGVLDEGVEVVVPFFGRILKWLQVKVFV